MKRKTCEKEICQHIKIKQCFFIRITVIVKYQLEIKAKLEIVHLIFIKRHIIGKQRD